MTEVPMQDRNHPSLPYQQQQRVPTGQQRSTNAQEEAAKHPPTFSAEDWLVMARKMVDEAVIRTRNDERLKKDVDVAQDQSRTIMTLTASIRRLKIYVGGLLGIAGSIGVFAATVMTAYQTARADAIEPAARAEAKAERANKKTESLATAVEDRLDAFDRRHETTEKILADLSENLKANTKAINQIDSKLDAVVQVREKRLR